MACTALNICSPNQKNDITKYSTSQKTKNAKLYIISNILRHIKNFKKS